MKFTSRHLLSELHGSAGALFGVILFVILFSGCWSLGQDALQRWAGSLPPSGQGESLPLERLLERARDRGIKLDGVSLVLPADKESGVTFCEAHQDCQTLDPVTGQPLIDTPALNVLMTLHKSAFSGFPGRVLISLFGIVMLILCVAGLLLHSRRWRDLWRWRRDRGLHRSMLDLHSLIGIWIFPWLLLFAVTGALSGLGALGTLLLSPVTYPDKPRQAFADLLGPPPPAATGHPLERGVDLDWLLEREALRNPNFIAQRLKLNHWGDLAATVEVSGIHRGLPSTPIFERRLYQLSDGALISERSSVDHGVWTRSFIAIQPLHFADYQWLGREWGAWLRALHLAMGLAACLLCASGLYLWGQRRSACGCWGTILLPRVAEGVCGGLVFASALLLLSLQLLPPALRAGSFPTWLFWVAWGGSQLTALALPRGTRALPLLLSLSGVICLLAASLHLYTVRQLDAWPSGAADLFLFVFGVFLCRPMWWLVRNAESRRHSDSSHSGGRHA